MAHSSKALAWAVLTITPLAAQMILQPPGKTVPQAKTREELDAFGVVIDPAPPRAILEAAARFRRMFPKSEFYEYACVAQMQAAMDLSDTRLAEETAATVLSLNSNNPEALLTLAELDLVRFVASTGMDSTRAALASERAKAALDKLRSLSLPALSDSHAWLRTKRSMLARAHLVLAEVAIRQKMWETAEHELQSVIDLAPSPKAYLLLSQVYKHTNREDEALAAAKKAHLSVSPGFASKSGDEYRVSQEREASQ